ncbi:hypothetical protein AX15_000403 [Amanita polypyramis BW_CC]|nr:hypothetical protein AX15_000403 [Amanita polypyramis BW_CC]
MVLGASLLAFALLATPALCVVKNYQLTLANKVVAPDGGRPRSAILVNGQTPGPLITAMKGDTLQVKVVNRLTDTSMAQGTSIHWHGLFQPRTAAMDGTTWVTQCPIAPGDEFIYKMSILQTGTYWYHSHITTQYCDGLRGPLVVYDPEDPLRGLYDVDNESTVITLGDWIPDPSPMAYRNNFENPNATLVNGLGRTPGSNSALAVIKVQSYTRYRFRVINTACIAAYNFSIDGHEMTVIETDGTETQSSKGVGIVTIWPGQRVSVVVRADRPRGNYWIRSVPFIVGVPPSNETGVNAAILRYDHTPNSEPTTTQTDFRLFQEQDVVSMDPPANISGTPDVKLNLEIALDMQRGVFTVNNQTYTPPTVPVLLQILSGKSNPYDLMPKGSIIPLPRNKLIEIVVPGGSFQAPHPMHLHGHKFGVVRTAGSSVVNTLLPVTRDVVNTGIDTTDRVTIRFRTDNPGPWFFHCHIDYHLEAGLAVVFAEDAPGQISGDQSEQVTEEWKNLCPKWNALKEGKQYSVSDLIGRDH